MAPSLKRKADGTTTTTTTTSKDANNSKNKKPKKDGSLTSFFSVPKPAAVSNNSSINKSGDNDKTGGGNDDDNAAPAVRFDKEKWVASLKPEQKELLQLEIDTLDVSWLAHLKDDLTSASFLELKRFLKREIEAGKKIFPPLEDVYSWSRHTPLHKVRVVLLGQDPYHNHNQAHGLCFSVRPPTAPPPSLRNIYIALRNDYPDFQAPPPKAGGLLTPWAEQGVLMLNTALTVRAHEAGSHGGKGWEAFTQRVIDTVVKVRTRGVVFLAWGLPAAKRCVKITGARHLVLKSVHPSPLSASKGFFDCGHFRKTNDWLAQRYGVDGQIDWNLGGGNKKEKEKEKVKEKEKEKEKEEKEKEKVKEKETTTESEPQKKEAARTTATTAKKDADEFDDIDDADAIEALEELARSSQPEGAK